MAPKHLAKISCHQANLPSLAARSVERHLSVVARSIGKFRDARAGFQLFINYPQFCLHVEKLYHGADHFGSSLPRAVERIRELVTRRTKESSKSEERKETRPTLPRTGPSDFFFGAGCYMAQRLRCSSGRPSVSYERVKDVAVCNIGCKIPIESNAVKNSKPPTEPRCSLPESARGWGKGGLSRITLALPASRPCGSHYLPPVRLLRCTMRVDPYWDV